MTLKNLAMYWDTDDKPLVYKDQTDMGQLMDSLIHQEKLRPPHSYLLKPINASLRAVLNTSDVLDMKVPKLTLMLDVRLCPSDWRCNSFGINSRVSSDADGRTGRSPRGAAVLVCPGSRFVLYQLHQESTLHCTAA